MAMVMVMVQLKEMYNIKVKERKTKEKLELFKGGIFRATTDGLNITI